MAFKNVTMKKFIIFCSLLFATNGVFAQGNLQFNQVLTYSGRITSSYSSYTSPTYTVPTGKVWKIETKTLSSSTLSFWINGYIYGDFTIIGAIPNYITNPIWLKSNDFIYFQEGFSGGSSHTDDYFISIIEYNIVP